MIAEYSVNLENKSKQELIMLLKDAQKVIANQENEIRSTQCYILTYGVTKQLKTATQMKIENEQNRLHLLEIERYRKVIEELKEEIENWKFTTKYVEDNYVHKDKIRKILEYYEHTPADNPDTTIAFYADIKKLLGGIKDE